MRRSDGKRHWFKAQDKFRDWETKIHQASLQPDFQFAVWIRGEMDSGAFIIDPNGFFNRSFTEQAAIDWVQMRVQEEMTDALKRDR